MKILTPETKRTEGVINIKNHGQLIFVFIELYSIGIVVFKNSVFNLSTGIVLFLFLISNIFKNVFLVPKANKCKRTSQQHYIIPSTCLNKVFAKQILNSMYSVGWYYYFL